MFFLQMKFNSLKHNFENVFLKEISLITQLFGKIPNLKYLSRFFSYKCFLISGRCSSSIYVGKLQLIRKKLRSDKTISNRPATVLFEIIQTQNLFAIYFCNQKMGIIKFIFWLKPFLFYLRTIGVISDCAVKNYT